METAWQSRQFRPLNAWCYFRDYQGYVSAGERIYPTLWLSNEHRYGRIAGGLHLRGERMMMAEAPTPMLAKSQSMEMDSDGITEASVAAPPPPPAPGAPEPNATTAPVSIRTNLQETAFFFPQLRTDSDGRIRLEFTSPEALTRWKLQLFGHTTDLQYVLDSKELVTQKELMILPNAPRFVREGDRLVFTAKVSNLSDTLLEGQATLELFDPETNQPLDAVYHLRPLETAFALAADGSQAMRWELTVPLSGVGVLGYRVLARAGNFSDGEEAAIPVLTNRLLLTEARPLFVPDGKTATFEMPRLVDAAANTDHQLFRLDITSNPAWEAIKALPYLQEYPYDCTEQMVNRYYANALATQVVTKYPQVKTIFESWRRSDASLKSPLQTNQDLKTALLEATPWVMDAKDESLQRERIALLFDIDRMANEQAVTLKKLLDRQARNGGFSWFPGGRENWYMTQYVAVQLAKVREATTTLPYDAQQALNRAVRYCDEQAWQHYQEMKKQGGDMSKTTPSPLIANYLYVRALAGQDAPLDQQYKEMYDYWWQQSEKYWLQTNLHTQGLLGLSAHISGNQVLANQIYTSLGQRALHSNELGMYWKYNSGWYWYQQPVETHVLLLEFFDKMDASDNDLSNMKIWLLRHKETNRWKTTTATAAAIHALTNTGDDWLAETTPLQVTFPKIPILRLFHQTTIGASTSGSRHRCLPSEVDNPRSTTYLGSCTLEERRKSAGMGRHVLAILPNHRPSGKCHRQPAKNRTPALPKGQRRKRGSAASATRNPSGR
ncbi:MAG: alpha-2-macroglobulin family protein [Saprospiraceae bacterium]